MSKSFAQGKRINNSRATVKGHEALTGVKARFDMSSYITK
jgi:hypothetical protein